MIEEEGCPRVQSVEERFRTRIMVAISRCRSLPPSGIKTFLSIDCQSIDAPWQAQHEPHRSVLEHMPVTRLNKASSTIFLESPKLQATSLYPQVLYIIHFASGVHIVPVTC